jgi:hypothetical protein
MGNNFTGLAAFVFILGFSLLLSPYRRTQFDYSRAAIQKTILFGFSLWLLGCLLLFVYDHCRWLINFRHEYEELFYIPTYFTGLFFTEKSGLPYRASGLALTVGFYWIIIYYILFQVSAIFSGKRNEYRMRKRQYDRLEQLIREYQKKGGGPAPRFEETEKFNAVKSIRILKSREVPYQWSDVFFRKVFDSVAFDEYWKKSLATSFLNLLTKRVEDRKGKTRSQKIELFLRTQWKSIKKIVVAPFYYQDIKKLTDMAWNQSEDMLFQLYKSQHTQGGGTEYIRYNGIDNEAGNYLKLIDNNPQPQMVSIHMSNGRIYNGWVINSTRPATGSPEFTILPHSTKHRSLDKNKVVSMTHYERAVWHEPRMEIIKPILNLLDALIQLNEDSQDLSRELSELRDWVNEKYYKYLYRSNGEGYEVVELLKLHPDHARKFFKSIKMIDVEMIHPYEINLSEDLFEQVQLIKREEARKPRFSHPYRRGHFR